MFKAEVIKLGLSTWQQSKSSMGWRFLYVKGKPNVIRLWKHPNPQPTGRHGDWLWVLWLVSQAAARWGGCSLLSHPGACRCLPSFPASRGRGMPERNSSLAGLGPRGWTLLCLCWSLKSGCTVKSWAKSRKFFVRCMCFASTSGGGMGSWAFHSQAALGSTHLEIHDWCSYRCSEHCLRLKMSLSK